MADALVKAKGVSRVEFDPVQAIATVSYDRDLANPDSLIAALSAHSRYSALVFDDL